MGTLKTIFVLALVFSGMVTSRAADFHLINNQFTHVYTNTFSQTATNGVNLTNSISTADSIYHTFHFVYTGTGTNLTTIVTERTLDGADYFPVVTNSIGTNGIIEAQYTGKWVNYRFRSLFQNTNAPTLNVYYISQ
jgi:hypothetical protein